jgi:hypothetical protein
LKIHQSFITLKDKARVFAGQFKMLLPYGRLLALSKK